MIKEILMASIVMLGGISTYKTIKYSDAPEAPIIQGVETDVNNPKAPVNKLRFSSKVMDKNILYATGFENGDSEYTYKYSEFPSGHNREFGGQSKANEKVFEGKYSTKIEDTINNGNLDLGFNSQGVHNGYETYSIMQLSEIYGIPRNTNIMLSLNILSEEEISFVEFLGVASTIDYPEVWDDKVFLEDAKQGETVLKVSGLTLDNKNYVDNGGMYYIVTKDNTDKRKGDYKYAYIKSIDLDNKTITLSNPLEQDFLAGSTVLKHSNANPIKFKKTEIKPKKDWQNIQILSEFDTNQNYSIAERGVRFWLQTETPGMIYIDNITLGYANEITLKRDDVQIYKGYNTEFEDRDAKDLEKPNKIENIQSSIIDLGSTNQIKVKFAEPTDNGSEYTYTATASFEGKESPVSEPVKSVITTGIDGYSYEINTNPSTEPDNTIDARETTITKEVPKGDNEYYIHIKSIDKAGNVSETIHKKIELQELTASLSESDSSIVLNWEFTDEMESYNFKVFRKEVNGEFEEISNNIKDLTYIDSNVSDKEKPNTPSLKETKYNEEADTLDFIFNDGADNGTEYSYYIEAYLDTGEKVATSNIVSGNLVSGLKGFSYKISNEGDNSLNDDILEIQDNKISVPISNNGEYIHIKSIDNNGNSSDTLSIKAFDDEKPTIDLRLTNYRPTKESTTIVVTGRDNIKVKSIKLPNGVVVNDRTANYDINKNGVYEFTVYDVAGNSFKKSIEITNIDITPPTIEFEEIKEEDGSYKIRVTANDGDFPVSHIILPDGQRVDGNTYTMTAEPNIIYEFTAYDMAGNFTKRSTQVSVMETKSVSANLDVYIKSQNMLSLSVSTNNITFDDFSGIQDEEKLNAITLTVNSSLPYDLRAYLPEEIRGSRFNKVMDKRIFNIRANGQEDYQVFTDTTTPLTLLSDQIEGNNKIHGIDLMLKGDLAHKKDIYKATVKFEVEQK